MRPKILLTNDDGIYAPGIKVLWKALQAANFADLFIVAPASEKTGMGVAITWDRPMHIQAIDWPGASAWSVTGTPADCVKLACRVILKTPPDWVISGVNAGSNAGRNVLHSGTIGAVIEGALQGIPGIAFSCEDGSYPNFEIATKYLVSMMQYAFEHPLPKGTVWNVNFPHVALDHVKGFKLTRQGKGRWSEDPKLHRETANGSAYWLGGKPDEFDEEVGCDIHFLRQGYVTAVPLHVHELTDHHVLKHTHEQFENFFQQTEKMTIS